MKIDEEKLREAMNRRLSGLTASPGRRLRIRQRIAQEEAPKMKKKLSVGLACALALTLLTVTALAAGLLLSPRVDAARIADQTLAERYDISQAMQTYFNRAVQQNPDGSITVTYTGAEHLKYALGEYTVTIREGKAVNACWSHDGESTEGGFRAEAWGAEQIREMLRLNQRDGSMQAFEGYIRKINKAHGIQEDPAVPMTDEESRQAYREWEETAREIKDKCRLTPQEMTAAAHEAVAAVYGLNAEQSAILLADACPDEDGSYKLQNGEPCFCIQFFLVQRPLPGDLYAWEEWTEKDGTYTVYVNVETGVVESILYESGLGGNG